MAEIIYPEGGWGWLCVAGRFLMQIVFAGLERSFGILYVILLDRYHASSSITAWLGSFQSTVRLTLAIPVGMLIHRFGERKVAIVGGFLHALGYFLSVFTPNIEVLYLTYGVIGGVGAALAYTPPFVIISRYFDKRRGLATGIAATGSGLGIFAMPHLTRALLEWYGFRGCLLVMSGIALNLLISGALYSPVHITLSLMARNRKRRSTHDTNIHPAVHVEEAEVDEQKQLLVSRKRSSTLPESSLKPSKLEEQFISRSYSHLQDKRSDSAMSPYALDEGSSFHLPPKTTDEKSDELLDKPKKSKHFDWSLLRRLHLLVYLAAVVFDSIGMAPVGTLLPAAAISRGVSFERSAMLISIIGIVDMTLRLSTGPLFDRPWFKPYRGVCWGVSAAFMGLAALGMAFADRLAVFAVLAGAFGAGAGVYIAQRPTILCDVVGSENVAGAFGVGIFAQGLGYLVAAPVGGALKDLTGAYTASFIFIGISGLFGGSGYALFDFFRIKRKQDVNKT